MLSQVCGLEKNHRSQLEQGIDFPDLVLCTQECIPLLPQTPNCLCLPYTISGRKSYGLFETATFSHCGPSLVTAVEPLDWKQTTN